MKYNIDGIKVLTTDPEKRIGLYAIRYLGKAGAHVSSISEHGDQYNPIGFVSKYLKTKISFPHEIFSTGLKGFLINNAHNYDFVCPIDISKMLVLLDTDKQHPLNCRFLLPKRESLIIADNKELLTNHAQQIGLKCPKTFFRVSPADLSHICRTDITYPCIIKFRGAGRKSHWRPDERYKIVGSPDELLSNYQEMHQIEEFPIIQEYIPGQGFGFFALYDKDRTLKAEFCHKRIREYPVTGGPSSCCESFYDPELVRIGKRLLESLDWSGLAMVEFKYDLSRRQFYIIEVNPRYWGSLPLAVRSGVNFPVLHALSALDVKYDSITQYRLGVKMRFFNTDIKAILTCIPLTDGFSKKFRLFSEIFNPFISDGLFDAADLRPLLRSLALAFCRKCMW